MKFIATPCWNTVVRLLLLLAVMCFKVVCLKFSPLHLALNRMS